MTTPAKKNKIPNREKLPRNKPRRRLPYFLMIVSFVGAGFLIMTYIMNAGDRPLVISPKTTSFVQPLKNGGQEVDFFAATKALYEPPILPEQNGFTSLLAVAGRTILSDRTPDWFWNALCEQLKLDPRQEPAGPFTPLHKYLETVFPNHAEYDENDYPPIQKRRIIYEEITTAPWSPSDRPYMADWLANNQLVLDTLVESSRSNAFFCPRLWRTDKELPETQVGNTAVTTMRLIDALIGRAMSRLSSDDTKEKEAALEDIIAACRFGRLMTNSVWMSDRQLRPALEIQPVTEPPAKLVPVLRHAKFDQEQLKRLAMQLDRLPLESYALHDIFMVGRFEALDVVSGLSCGRFPRTHPLLVELLPAADKGDGIDWSIVAQSVSRFFEESLPILGEKDPAKRETMPEAAGVFERSKKRQSGWHIPTRRSRSEQIGDLLAIRAATLPKTLCLFESRRRAWVDLLRLAVALERYRLENGGYPATLEPLEPDFLATLPTDPFTAGKPYVYRLETAPNVPDESGAAKGSGYLLYSVSADLKDDGGYTREELMSQEHVGDLRVRMPTDSNFYKMIVQIGIDDKKADAKTTSDETAEPAASSAP